MTFSMMWVTQKNVDAGWKQDCPFGTQEPGYFHKIVLTIEDVPGNFFNEVHNTHEEAYRRTLECKALNMSCKWKEYFDKEEYEKIYYDEWQPDSRWHLEICIPNATQ